MVAREHISTEDYRLQKVKEVNTKYESNDLERRMPILIKEAEERFKDSPNSSGIVNAVIKAYEDGHATNLTEALAYIDSQRGSSYLDD